MRIKPFRTKPRFYAIMAATLFGSVHFATGTVSEGDGVLSGKAPVCFVDMARSAGVWRTGLGWGLAWTDLDQDGDQDLLLPSHDIDDPILLLNNGNGTFSDISDHIPERPYADHHMWRWTDIDNDGDPDLSAGIGSTGGRTFNYYELFRNNGGGWLEDLTDRVKLGDLKTRGRGITWFDADHDGLLDAFLTAHLPLKEVDKYEGFLGTQFYRNKGGFVFKDHSFSSGLHHAGHACWAAPGDFDNDNDIDLIVQHHRERPYFFENTGGLTFRNITAEQPFADLEYIFDVDWVDYDADGDLDLFISQGTSQRNGVSEGYHYQANEVAFYFTRSGKDDTADEIVIGSDSNHLDIRNCEEFSEVVFGRNIFRPLPEQYAIGRDAHAASAVPVEIVRHPELNDADKLSKPEIDADAAPRVYVWHALDEAAWHIRFVRAEGNVGRSYSALVTLTKAVRSVRLADCEFMPYPNFLFENRNGTFVDVTRDAGLYEEENTGNALWQDFDNDGDLDLLLSRSSFSYDGAAPFVFYENQGNSRFRPMEHGLGLERRVVPGRAGAACADYDNDGYIDVAMGPGLSNPPFRFGESMLFRNLGQGNHWLKIALRGTKSNADGIGAWIFLEAGGKRQTRYHIAGQSFTGQDTAILHFGLGELRRAERITVQWPSGVRQILENVPADQQITIQETE
jgi:hypothetical protein